MQIGDLVVSWTNPDTSEIGIIVGINKNGVYQVHFQHGVYEIASYWLKVINEDR